MIVDTDVLIWHMRGHDGAKRIVDGLGRFRVSAVTYMEVLQGLRDNTELRELKRFMANREVECLPVDRTTTDRAIYLMERFTLSHGLRMGDALIAATADLLGDKLLTANAGHYRMIPGLELERFRP